MDDAGFKHAVTIFYKLEEFPDLLEDHDFFFVWKGGDYKHLVTFDRSFDKTPLSSHLVLYPQQIYLARVFRRINRSERVMFVMKTETFLENLKNSFLHEARESIAVLLLEIVIIYPIATKFRNIGKLKHFLI